MVSFACCVPIGLKRRKSKASGIDSPASSAASDHGGSIVVDRRSGFSSMIVHNQSITCPASVYASEGSPGSVHGSLIASENGNRRHRLRHAGTDSDISPHSFADCAASERELDRDSAWYHVARLREALQITTHELRVTEIELKHAYIQLAKERERNDFLMAAHRESSSPTILSQLLGSTKRLTKSKRSGSCPLATYGLPTSSVDFATINSVIRDNSSY